LLLKGNLIDKKENEEDENRYFFLFIDGTSLFSYHMSFLVKVYILVFTGVYGTGAVE